MLFVVVAGMPSLMGEARRWPEWRGLGFSDRLF